MRTERLILFLVLALLGLTPLFAEAAPYGATYAPAAVSTLNAGQTITVSVTVTNTGTLTWTPTGSNPFRLSYHWYRAGTAPATGVPTSPAPNYGAEVWNGLRTNLPRSINPGQSVTLSAKVQAPSAPATYVLKWDMVHENVTWFAFQGVPTRDQAVTVQRPAFAAPVKQSLSLAAVCRLTDCTPVITRVVPLFSLPTPGGPVVIEGRLFGARPGSIRLIGTIPRGAVGAIPGERVTLEPLQWSDTIAAGTIPALTGVLDQEVKLQVITSDGFVSNAVSVQFRATRELRPLPQGDVKVIMCGFDSNDDRCNGVKDPSDSGPFLNFSGTLDAEHYNCWGCIGDDAGTDIYEIKLINGWNFDSMDLFKYVVSTGDDVRFGVGDLPAGQSYWKPSIVWRVTPNDSVAYSADVTIIGPKGVPHR
ncbi:MAG TPA: hypothetical protein VI337_02225 [Nitrospirales bacterium]|nr:hypothetical protein [Nitrospirales bacterium]